jgi:hypothetical protein
MIRELLLRDPGTADDDVVIVENSGLAWSDGTLWLIEGNKNLIGGDLLKHGGSGLVPVTNLHGDAHGFAQIFHRN